MPTGIYAEPEGPHAGFVRSALAPAISASSSHRRRVLLLTFLCGLTVVLGVLRGATRPLWFDEIVTANIAGARSWHEMLSRSRAIDLHPPLEPALVRLSFALFGRHELAAHLPSTLAFTIAVGSLFLFLSRRMPLLFAAAGALLPLADAEVAYYLVEARPYALLFGAASLALLAYDTILHHELRPEHRAPHETLSRLALAASLVVLLQAHLFGTLAAACFFLAEAVRTLRLRRFDGWTWAAVALPWLSCITYVALLRTQAGPAAPTLVYELKDRTGLLHGLGFYHQFLYLPLAPLLKGMVVVLLLAPFFPRSSFFRYLRAAPELWVVLVLLTLMPVSITLLLKLKAPTSGFFFRYAIVAVVPSLALLAAAVGWRAVNSRGVGLIFLLGVLAACAASFSDLPSALRTLDPAHPFAAPSGVQSAGGVDRICPGLPLVIDNPLQFLESDNRLPAGELTRMVYLSGAAESLRLEHHTSSESVGFMSVVFERPRHVVPGARFLAAHNAFVMLTRPRKPGWVSDELKEQHALMEPLGRYRFTGENLDLWLVSQDRTPPPAESGCAAAGVTPR